MHRATLCVLATAIASSSSAHADAPVSPPSSTKPPWFIGGRVGVTALTRYGATSFEGTGLTYSFELGVDLRPDLVALIGVDVGPRLEREVHDYKDGDFSKRAIFSTALVEYHRAFFLYGAGVGLVHETTDRAEWTYDHSGLPDGPYVVSDSANGAIGAVRVCAAFNNPLLPLVIVAQGYAMWFPMEPARRETGYMATLGIGFRFPP